MSKLLARAAVIAAVMTAGAFASTAAAFAAPASQPSVAQQNVCQTVASVAAPIMALVEINVIDLDTALARIAEITGLPVEEVAACLAL